ncbi:hypothetical protein [Streptomyces sp. NPDC059398]|uniref:hypothetical protein n=1 Tax=Streptomyces sp. NPDC059398 TaxID=3346820 RepID=UPI0036BA9C81
MRQGRATRRTACAACKHPRHRISLGSISVAEAAQFAQEINRRLDGLAEGPVPA